MKLLNMFLNLLNASDNINDVVEKVEQASEGMSWHPKDALGTLSYMGKGMLVIFVLIGVIILATLLINKIFAEKKNSK